MLLATTLIDIASIVVAILFVGKVIQFSCSIISLMEGIVLCRAIICAMMMTALVVHSIDPAVIGIGRPPMA